MKKILPIFIAGAISAQVIPSNADSVRITEENIPFAYETRTEVPTPPETLAKLISEDYLNAKDEFSARELFQKIEPVLTKRIEAAKATALWRIEITNELPSYDFDAKAFPTGLAETTFVPFSASGLQYAAMFTNHEKFRNVPVEIDAAKKLSVNLRRSRNSTLIVEGVVKAAEEKNLNYNKRKTVFFEISNATIKLADGTLVGGVSLSGKGPNQGTASTPNGLSPAAAPDPASAKVDPVGEWTTKERSPSFSLCLWESGEARGEFDSKDLAIHLEGNWHVVKDGRWKGYVIFAGKVDYWGIGQKNVIPTAETFEFLLGLEGDKLCYVKGGVLTDKNGGKFYPSGKKANDDPNLYRQNSPRPVRRELGNQ